MCWVDLAPCWDSLMSSTRGKTGERHLLLVDRAFYSASIQWRDLPSKEGSDPPPHSCGWESEVSVHLPHQEALSSRRQRSAATAASQLSPPSPLPTLPPSPLPTLTPTPLVVTRHSLWHELGQCAGSSKLTPPPRSPYTSSIHQKQMPLSGLAAVSHARTLPQEDGQRLLEGPWAQLISKVYLKKHPTLPRCYTLNAKDKKMVNDFWKARACSGSA